jgi:hypothetical protein
MDMPDLKKTLEDDAVYKKNGWLIMRTKKQQSHILSMNECKAESKKRGSDRIGKKS